MLSSLILSSLFAFSADAKTSAANEPTTLPSIRLEPAFASLTFERPVQITHAGDGSDRLFVVEQPGRVLVFPNSSEVEKAEVFIDLTDPVNDATNEEGPDPDNELVEEQPQPEAAAPPQADSIVSDGRLQTVPEEEVLGRQPAVDSAAGVTSCNMVALPLTPRQPRIHIHTCSDTRYTRPIRPVRLRTALTPLH